MVMFFLLLSVELLLLLVVVLLGWLGWVNLCCHWLRAQDGNLQC